MRTKASLTQANERAASDQLLAKSGRTSTETHLAGVPNQEVHIHTEMNHVQQRTNFECMLTGADRLLGATYE